MQHAETWMALLCRRFQNQQAFTDQILKALTGETCFLLSHKRRAAAVSPLCVTPA